MSLNEWKLDGRFAGIEKEGPNFISFYIGVEKKAYGDKPASTMKVKLSSFKNTMPTVKGLTLGDKVICSGRIGANEYQSKWFTSLACADVVRVANTGQTTIDDDQIPF